MPPVRPVPDCVRYLTARRGGLFDLQSVPAAAGVRRLRQRPPDGTDSGSAAQQILLVFGGTIKIEEIIARSLGL